MLLPRRRTAAALRPMMPLYGTLLEVNVKTFADLATVLAALAAVAGVLVAIRAIGAQIKTAQEAAAAQIKSSQAVAAVDTLFRLIDRWQSSDMVGRRKVAARGALAKRETPQINDVLGFFEFVGFLLDAKAIDLEGVWVNLSNDALFTWSAYYDLTIKRDQSKDRTFWEDFSKLVDAMRNESMRRGEPEEEYRPDEPAWTHYLEEEAALGVTPDRP